MFNIYIYIYIFLHLLFVALYYMLAFGFKFMAKVERMVIGIWYIYLKIKIIRLKICVKIRVSEKLCENTYNII